MTIIVHHLQDSRSQRVLWLLEELGVAYEVKRYERNPVTRLAPPELLAIHPLGKSPVITIDDLVFAETGAIFEALLDRFDTDHRLHPPRDHADYAMHRYWMHYAEGSAQPPLVMKLIMGLIPDQTGPAFGFVEAYQTFVVCGYFAFKIVFNLVYQPFHFVLFVFALSVAVAHNGKAVTVNTPFTVTECFFYIGIEGVTAYQ